MMKSSAIKTILIMIATVGGLGFLPTLQATFTSLVIYPLMIFLWPSELYIQISVIVVVFFVGTYASYRCIEYFNKSDPRQVVIDELSGITFSLLLIPQVNWKIALAGFLLFRFFDIKKPLGIRQLEKIPYGFGIVLDDVLAGIYTNIILLLLYHYSAIRF